MTIFSSRTIFPFFTQVNWMDEKTRKAALEKLNWIEPHIGYPSEYLDDSKLDDYHQYLKVYPESFLKSDLSLNLFQRAYEFDRLRQPVNKSDWISHGQTAIVNAFYEPSENSIREYIIVYFFEAIIIIFFLELVSVDIVLYIVELIYVVSALEPLEY